MKNIMKKPLLPWAEIEGDDGPRMNWSTTPRLDA